MRGLLYNPCMHLIDGNKLAEEIKTKLKGRIERLESKPKLVIVYAGENSASQIYVDMKLEAAKEVGMDAELIRLTQTTTEELTQIVERLNNDKSVSGYIIQLPLPENVETVYVLEKVSPLKDVDGLSPLSLGLLWQNNPHAFASATPLATLECLKHAALYADKVLTYSELNKSEDEILLKYLKGKNVLLINKSLIVGKPLAALLLKYETTLSIAHKTTDREYLKKLITQNDIIISGTGVSGLIDSSMVKSGQVLIDIGINKSALGVGGDINTEGMKDMDVWVTPVPGGVGPITVAKLLQNTYKAFKLQNDQ